MVSKNTEPHAGISTDFLFIPSVTEHSRDSSFAMMDPSSPEAPGIKTFVVVMSSGDVNNLKGPDFFPILMEPFFELANAHPFWIIVRGIAEITRNFYSVCNSDGV